MPLYLAIALLVWLVGLGLQRALGLRGGWRAAALAPVTGLAALTLLLQAAVALAPLDRAAPAVWALAIALAGVGAREALRVRAELRAHALDGGLLLLLPCVLLGPRVWEGLFDHPGSLASDGWAYAVHAEYLRAHWPGTDGLTPSHQLGAGLSTTRLASASWLALLAPWTPSGDARAALSPYVAVCAFALGASVLCSAVEVGLSARWRRIVTALTLLAGWTHVLVALNNLDQLLWTAFVPAAVTLCAAAELGLALGVVLGAAFVDYPELSPILGLLVAGVVAARAVRRGPPLPWRAAAVAGLCAAPFAPRSLRLLARQAAAAGASTARPGEGMLPELLDPGEAVGSWWRLVPSDTLLGGPGARPYRWAAALLLFALAVRGARLLWRRDQPAAACALAVCWPLAAALLVGQGYDYGAYKLLATAWWAACLAMCVGLATWDHLAVRPAGAAALGAAVLLDGALHHTRLGVWTLGLRSWLDPLASAAITVGAACSLRAAPGSPPRRGGAWRLALPALLALWGLRQVVRGGPYDGVAGSTARDRVVSEVPAIAGGEPVWLGVDDRLAFEWAVYYLRDADVRLHARRGYLAIGRLALDARDEVGPAPLLLVDGALEPPGWTTLWRGGGYRLVRPSSPRWLFAAGLAALGAKDGAPDGESPLDVLSCAAGEVELRWTGPGAGELLLRRVGDVAPPLRLDAGASSARFAAPRGSSRWTLRRVDRSRPILEGARATLAE